MLSRPWLLPAILIAIVFFPSRKIPFLLDDYQIYLNHWPVVGWDAFFHDVTHHFQQNRPLAHASWYLQLILEYPNPASPYWFHWANLVLHGLNTILVFRFVRTMGSSLAAATLTSAFFGVHPSNMEAVSYLYGRSDLMVTAFILGTLILLKEGPGKFRLAIPCALLAVFSKETAVVLPALYLCCTAVFLPKSYRFSGPAFCLTVASALIAMAGFLFLKTDHADNFGYAFSNASQYLLLQPFCLFVGLIRVVFPWGYTIVYQFDLPAGIFDPMVVGPALFWAAVIGYGVRQWKRGRRVYLFSAAWYLAALSPTNSVVPRLDQISDRHFYLALIGPFFAMACALESAWERHGAWVRKLSWAAVLVFGALTFTQNLRWQSAMHIWGEAAKRYPNWAMVHRELAAEYGRAGQADKEREILESVTRRWPADWTSWNNLGILHASSARHGVAQESFRRALEHVPVRHRPILMHNLAVSCQSDAKIDTAVALYREVLALDPNYISSKQNLAVVLWQRGDVEEAERLLREILSKQPQNAMARRTLDLMRAKTRHPRIN